MSADPPTRRSCTATSPTRGRLRVAFGIPALVVAASSGSAQVVLHVKGGDDLNDDFGLAVAIAGDVDGDGFVDWIVGAPGDDNGGFNTGNVRVWSGSDGTELFSFDGDDPFDFMGSSVAGGADLDGDDVPDFVFGQPSSSDFAPQAGGVRAHSGADGAELFSIHAEQISLRYGTAVASVGDVDLDGSDDFVVGGPGNWESATTRGVARIHSGATGAAIRAFEGNSLGDNFGYSVAGAGDVDADGVPDVIVGAPNDDDFGASSGSATVFSGSTGAVLFTFFGASEGDEFGYSVAGAGDVDRDGHDDLVVGARFDDTSGTRTGSARVFSGLDGSVLHLLHGDSDLDEFGGAVSGGGDLDGDGFDDVLVGAQRDDDNGADSGSVRAVSGRTGATLATLLGDTGNDRFGCSLAGGGDVNADGLPDVVVGAFRDFFQFQQAGRAFVWGLPFVTPADSTLSLSAADSAPMTVDYGPARAGHVYWLLGSASGRFPGTPFPGGLTLPLNVDPYFNLIVKKPFAAVFSGFLGVLDANGTATPALVSPAGTDPSLAGVVLDHALIVGAMSGVVDATSNAVSIELVP